MAKPDSSVAHDNKICCSVIGYKGKVGLLQVQLLLGGVPKTIVCS